MKNNGKGKKIPDTLCPFLERECPQGEETARICWQRMNTEDEASGDKGAHNVDCLIADWMFSRGNGHFA